jgi:hypothetical protein
MAAVTKATVRNFGDMRNGVRFGVPLPELDNGVKSLLLKYNKRFCGANDWRTGKFVDCTGSEDIQFVQYGFNISNVRPDSLIIKNFRLLLSYLFSLIPLCSAFASADMSGNAACHETQLQDPCDADSVFPRDVVQ